MISSYSNGIFFVFYGFIFSLDVHSPTSRKRLPRVNSLFSPHPLQCSDGSSAKHWFVKRVGLTRPVFSENENEKKKVVICFLGPNRRITSHYSVCEEQKVNFRFFTHHFSNYFNVTLFDASPCTQYYNTLPKGETDAIFLKWSTITQKQPHFNSTKLLPGSNIAPVRSPTCSAH